MTISHITDHVSRALANLLTQYADSDKLRELVRIILEEVQQAEDLAWQVYTEISLATAEGVQLDEIWGVLLNQLRGFLTDDDDYRGVLGARLKADLSDGAVEEILAIVYDIWGADPIRYCQHGRASYSLCWTTPAPGTDLELSELGAEIVGDATAAGVAWQITEGDDPDALVLGVGPPLGTGILGRLIGSSYGVDLT